MGINFLEQNLRLTINFLEQNFESDINFLESLIFYKKVLDKLTLKNYIEIEMIN